VSRLRGALGRDAVVAQPAGYVLQAAREQVDTVRFERLLREGREALARGAAGLAAERLTAALALWRGPALADVADGGALAAEARRLDELRLDCIEDRIDADLERARHAELVPELRALLEEHPLRERLWRQLVLALYRAERQAEALETFHEARTRLDAELGLEPSPELKELELQILRHEVAPAAPVEARHNLPAATTSFVGRERELEELVDLLREHRLVTLTGMGGAGKTRLAVETARRPADAFADGVWLVDLTALADPRLVVGAVTATVTADAATVEPTPAALAARIGRRELLLVLDNCEHLVTACAELVESLLPSCPNLRILATSRVPLAVAGEFDYALDPLAESHSVRLFVERARAVRRDLATSDDDALATILEICRELDGLPLAIELAAARAKALSLAEIAARLDDRLRFLRAWQRVADPRHRTLETTMDWSYELLDADEQQLLRRLGVFAGGATLDAVAFVCLDGDEDAAVELLTRLVDASLVRAEPHGETRYRLLETVRQYATAKLADDADGDEVRRRHAEHYLAVAESAHLGLDARGVGPQRQEIVLDEQHNIRAALDWADGNNVELGLRLALALENFWAMHAPVEGKERLRRLLEHADGVDVGLRARATRDYGAFADILFETELAREQYALSGELFAEAGDEFGVATARSRLGVIAGTHDGDHVRARELFEESLAVMERIGSRVGVMEMIGQLGAVAFNSGDYERARPLLEQSIEMAREIGWRWWEARYSAALAQIHLAERDLESAERRTRHFLSLATEMRLRHDLRMGLALLARIAAARGDGEHARALWSTVESIEEPPGRFGRFDADAWATEIPDGPRPEPLPLDEAVELALAG
jgi:predicted ATPase/DNA-binding SARP family transcriptional activator